MQLFVKLLSAKTVVLEVDSDAPVSHISDRVCEIEGILPEEQRLAYGGKQLSQDATIKGADLREGATLQVLMRMRGGAAARLKKEADEEKHKREMEKEYKNWHHLADCTESTGIMRLLCVSLVLEKSKAQAHGMPDAHDNEIAGAPECDAYEYHLGVDEQKDFEYEREGLCPCEYRNGWAKQEELEKRLKGIKTQFMGLWRLMDPVNPVKDALGSVPKEYKLAGGNADRTLKKGDTLYIETGKQDGIWWDGPTKIKNDKGEVLFDYRKLCKEAGIWIDDSKATVSQKKGDKEGDKLPRAHANSLAYPWKIGGDYGELERWIYGGIGTVTYISKNKWADDDDADEKGKKGVVAQRTKSEGPIWIKWSEMDLDGPLALTDKERLVLRQIYQLTKKTTGQKNAKLNQDEQELLERVNELVQVGPMHDQNNGVYQWMIRPLKKLMAKKCVFWTNTENFLPNGSVRAKTRTKQVDDSAELYGTGLELLEFWKYEEKIGILRKDDILEDRQRLMDQIEIFTPTYKAVIKNKGQDAEDGEGNHYMIDDNLREITNIVALAMDMHMPDYQEDKIACFVKTQIEQTIGPTWHVIVGRSFGFAVQCEARHFLHMFMQHLAFIIWKSEPDPNSGKPGNVGQA